jgi:hypothetical protein
MNIGPISPYDAWKLTSPYEGEDEPVEDENRIERDTLRGLSLLETAIQPEGSDMSYCRHCRFHYRELPDEQGDHPCPSCGREPHEREVEPEWLDEDSYDDEREEE